MEKIVFKEIILCPLAPRIIENTKTKDMVC